MATHELKIWPDYFAALLDGSKTFEVRKDDRVFQVGDTLVLQEWRPYWQSGKGTHNGKLGDYTGSECKRTITYVLCGGQYGIDDGYVVMGLADPQQNTRLDVLERVLTANQRLSRALDDVTTILCRIQRHEYFTLSDDELSQLQSAITTLTVKALPK